MTWRRREPSWKSCLSRRKTSWTSSSFRSGHSCRSGYCCEIAQPISEHGDGASPRSADLGARQRMTRHFLAFRKEPDKFQEFDTFQEVVARIAPERIDHAISSFVRNQCYVRLGCLGSSSMALYLAIAKGTPQLRESEAHPAAAWVQVPRIGICGAGCCVSRVTCHICSTSSLRCSHNRHSGFARPGHPGNLHGDSAA